MKKLLPFCALLVLAACASPEQLAERKRLQDEQDFNTCVSYGFRPGSEAFGNCRLQLDLSRREAYQYNPYSYRPHIGTGIYYVR